MEVELSLYHQSHEKIKDNEKRSYLHLEHNKMWKRI